MTHDQAFNYERNFASIIQLRNTMRMGAFSISHFIPHGQMG